MHDPSPALPLITERLVLAMPLPEHAPRILTYLESNRTHFAATSPSGPSLTLDVVSGKLAAAISEYEKGREMKLYMSLRAKDVQDPIGDIALTEIVRGPFQACYMSYRIGAEYEGQGYVKESIESVVAYAFTALNLHRIMANYIPTNERSAAVLRRTGFTVEGTARDYLRLNSEWRDHVLASRINPHWRPEP
jgi:[ribosomal protein S5]-alanine N-acetyltransferase